MQSRLELPPQESSISPALHFLRAYAEGLGMPAERRERLEKASEMALSFVVHNLERDGKNSLGVVLSESEGMLKVEVINRGVPLFLNGKSQLFHQAAQGLDKVSIENHGREGQSVCLRMRLGEEAAKRALEASGFVPAATLDPEAEIVLREMQPGEESALSQLFYYVYGYDYINEFVYYPEKLRQMREEGKLISIVAAMPGGRIVGHVGLIKWNDQPPVYEPCLGVTDPQMKSRGLFGRVFKATMERVRATPMQYCFFDFVTNHEYSQRFVAKYQPVDLAIFVGCQSKETQARLERIGLGPDPKETDRYSLLYSIIPQVTYPFGKEISLPANLGEWLGFLLKPLNLSWRPAPRFELLPAEGEYQTHLQPAQSAVIFDLHKPGRAAVERILKQWHQLLRSHYQYAGVEVAVGSPGLGNLYDLLAGAGFFLSGFVPYHRSDRLALRFQSLGPTKVSFDEIMVYSETSKRLLEMIRSNYERNAVL